MSQVVTVQVGSQGQSRNWSTGTCSCCSDCSVCICGTFCSCCYLCLVAPRLDETCCLGLWPFSLMALRTKMRIMQNIKGSVCDDCIKSHLCYPCALCQLSREISHSYGN